MGKNKNSSSDKPGPSLERSFFFSFPSIFNTGINTACYTEGLIGLVQKNSHMLMTHFGIPFQRPAQEINFALRIQGNC